MTNAAIEKLEQHDWPGNVRELENVLQRGLVLAGNEPIRAEHLMIEMQDMMHTAPTEVAPAPRLAAVG